MKPFYSKDLNDVSKTLLDFLIHNQVNNMIDLGCGTGDLFYILGQHNLLPKHSVGVEIDPESCQYFKQYLPSAEIFCQDIRGVLGTIKETFDLVTCEQVIEHIEDDNGLLRMMNKLLNKNGRLYISSIIRKKHAWWFHRYNGEVRINPEHVREYESEAEFLFLLQRNGFKVIKTSTKKTPFIVAHQVDRLLIKLINDDTLRRWYDRFSALRFLRKKLVFPIPGFYLIEALAESNNAA